MEAHLYYKHWGKVMQETISVERRTRIREVIYHLDDNLCKRALFFLLGYCEQDREFWDGLQTFVDTYIKEGNL